MAVCGQHQPVGGSGRGGASQGPLHGRAQQLLQTVADRRGKRQEEPPQRKS